MTSIEWCCLWIWSGWKVLILLVIWMINEMWIDVFWCVISLLNMIFSVEFERMPYFQGVEGIFEWYEVIFGLVRMDENGVKWAFCRSWYRTWKWGFRRGNNRYALSGKRMLALKCKLSPHPDIKTYYNSTVLWYVFDCQVIIFYTLQ